ncbi:hypothetical protein GCM10007860_02210 [Chitiniphilus shinanonensis]|uniref:Uncharacterized protein n=1 Tax=Chitiniphilus shinanonensis TaxID=553088 RepID=A0ABQ6BT59_9NEIS|nr:hypothetical protein [Chitiniphilus shinanonensis]GLS03078.1 hypothetical protein GCM10007860_02210 [Chitiniphilus shinanonensis]
MDNSLSSQQRVSPAHARQRRTLRAGYRRLTARMVPRVRHALAAIATVAALAGAVGLCFVAEWRFGIAHAAVALLALSALWLQHLRLRRERALGARRDQTREAILLLDVLDDRMPAPRLHQAQPRPLREGAGR